MLSHKSFLQKIVFINRLAEHFLCEWMLENGIYIMHVADAFNNLQCIKGMYFISLLLLFVLLVCAFKMGFNNIASTKPW